MPIFTNQRIVLIVGDVVTISLITIIGFASHGTATSAGTRMLTTFFPLTAAWFLIAPFLGVYDRRNVVDWRQLWRPFWSMVLAAPMAAWMRGLVLDSAILPIFVIILGGVSAIGMLLWRGVFWFTGKKITNHNG